MKIVAYEAYIDGEKTRVFLAYWLRFKTVCHSLLEHD